MVGFCWSFSSTIRLKETIEKQKKDHQLRKDYGYVTEKIEVFNQHAMSDIERAALQAKERLKKEMAMRIEETKTQMLKQGHRLSLSWFTRPSI